MFLGFILISFGLVILALSSSETASGFFFIFPFFFVGDLGTTGLFYICVAILVTGVLICQLNRFGSYRDKVKPQHVITCVQCNEKLPMNADYCLRCGNPVND